MTKLTLHIRLKHAIKELANFLWLIALVLTSIALIASIGYVVRHAHDDSRVTDVIMLPESSDILEKTDFYHDMDSDEEDTLME